MRLSDLLTEGRIKVPLEASDLAGALDILVRGLQDDGGLRKEASPKLAREIASGHQGEVVRTGPDGIVVLARTEAVGVLVASLGIASAPLQVDVGDPEISGPARVVLLVLTPRGLANLEESFVPALIRTFGSDAGMAGLLAASNASAVRSLRPLMDLDVRERLLVEDALEPLQYRIFPDTPLREAAELMVRRELHAVPVVGEDLGVLGIISVGDALKRLLPMTRPDGEAMDGAGGNEPASVTARDVMTRTVLCISESESLLQAGKLMVNRDVEQLPVVREGELIGFVTRDAILKRIVDLLPADG
ncbi:MAG TPA: CBS domain-containing protein [Longimicrobiales bacterium]|jgi:CBS domain-containing protein